MEILIALDIDGTLETGAPEGYVKTHWLQKLEASGCTIEIVSESPYYPKHKNGKSIFSREHMTNRSRYEHLYYLAQDFDAKHGAINIKIYVSDNGDLYEARKAGYLFVEPSRFKYMCKNFPLE